ncbi:MAG: stage V sporulation protein G [Candidatus Staskawiczbacteria bacterium]|nr:stage V sporulation protein G [Candidatus Staskawiczbacteria bacterium]
MVITEVRVKLMAANDERLQAFCSVTFDYCFVIHDLKIIEGDKGGPFVAMPSRKLTDLCTGCGSKNHLRARHCNQCGTRLDENRAVRNQDGRAKLHADIAHPINSICREYVNSVIIKAFRREQDRALKPGYRCRFGDYDADYEPESCTAIVSEMVTAHKPKEAVA